MENRWLPFPWLWLTTLVRLQVATDPNDGTLYEVFDVQADPRFMAACDRVNYVRFETMKEARVAIEKEVAGVKLAWKACR